MDQTEKPRLIVVTGPTATGKTAFAVNLAHCLNGEIISADSRQVYRGMNLATGKDFSDYEVKGEKIPYHLVDIADPGYEYNVYRFQKDFNNVYQDIVSRGRVPVLCGGTGLYIDSVLKGFRLVEAPINLKLRKTLENKTDSELTELLTSLKRIHNITDISDRNRLIRAIEIQMHALDDIQKEESQPRFTPYIFALWFDRETIRSRITHRLKARLEAGMADEVKELLNKGLSPDQLKFYGLEYRYLTQYVTGEISFDEMFRLLNTAIHQFAKRQMTWFRKMEREGTKIHWIEGSPGMAEKVETALLVLGEKV